MPDHSNLIFVFARYTLDELIFKALYDQDSYFFEAMEPLVVPEEVHPAASAAAATTQQGINCQSMQAPDMTDLSSCFTNNACANQP